MSMKKYFQELVRKHLEKKMETPRQRGLRMEPLEDRMLLSATPVGPNGWDTVKLVNNEQFSLDGESSGEVGLVLKVNAAEQTQDREVVIGLMVSGSNGFTPETISIEPGTGDSYQIQDITGTRTDGSKVLLLTLNPGSDGKFDELGFKVNISGAASAQSGNFSCCVFTPGSTDGNGFVDQYELDACEKHVLYTSWYDNGAGMNPASIQILQGLIQKQYGETVDLTNYENVYNSIYDVNRDARVTDGDLALMEKGLTAGMTVSLDWFDTEAPTIPSDSTLWGGEVSGDEGTGYSVKVSDTDNFYVPISDKTSVASVKVVINGQEYDGVFSKTGTSGEMNIFHLTGIKDGGQTKSLADALGVAANGEYSLTVQATDVAGNQMKNPVSVKFAYVAGTVTDMTLTSVDTSLIAGTAAIDTLVIDEENISEGTGQIFAPTSEKTSTVLKSGATLSVELNDQGKIINVEYNRKTAYQKLSAGEENKETVTIKFQEGTASKGTWEFELEGVNVAPVGTDHTASVDLRDDTIFYDSDEKITSLNLITTVTDVNKSDVLSFKGTPVIPAEVQSAVTIAADGTVSFKLDELKEIYKVIPEGEKVSFTITYTVQDDHGGDTGELKLNVTVTCKNEAPTAEDVTGTIDASAAGRIVFTWDGSDPDRGETETLKLNAVKINNTEYTITADNKFKAEGAEAVDSVAVAGYGVYTLEEGAQLVYTLDADYQEKLLWETSDEAGLSHTKDIELGGLGYQLKDVHDATSEGFAAVTYTYKGAFDELVIVSAPDQEVNALTTEQEITLDKPVTFSSDAEQTYEFKIESVGDGTYNGLLSFDNDAIVYGQNGKISIKVNKTVLDQIKADAAFGDYTITYSYKNTSGHEDAKTGLTFKLNVVGYEVTVTPGTIEAGELNEDDVYKETDPEPKQIEVDLTEKITSVIAKKTGESEGQSVTDYKFSTDLTLVTISGTGAETLDKKDFAALATIDADGNLTFRLTQGARDLIQYLQEGQSIKLAYQYKLTNIKVGTEEIAGTFVGGLAEIVLNGVNDAPVAGTVNISLNDTGISGTVKSGVTDVEEDPLTYETQSVSIKYQTASGEDVTDTYKDLIAKAADVSWLTNSDGTYTFTNQEVFVKIPVGISAVLTYSVKVSDDKGGECIEKVEVTIVGTNQNPTAAVLDNVTVDAGDETAVNWSAKASDIDALDEVSLAKIIYNSENYAPATEAQKIDIVGGKVNGEDVSGKAGDFGYLTLNADGTISFTATGDYLKWHLADGDQFTFTFDYVAKDNHDAVSSPATVTVTVNGKTDNAVISCPETMSVTNKATAGEDGWVKISGDITYQFDKGQSYEFSVKKVGDIEDAETLKANFKVEVTTDTATGKGTATLYIQKDAMTGDTPLFAKGDYEVKIAVSGGALAAGDETQTSTLSVKDKGALTPADQTYGTAISEDAEGEYSVDLSEIEYKDPDDPSIGVTKVVYKAADSLSAALTLTKGEKTYTTEEIKKFFDTEDEYNLWITGIESSASITAEGKVTFTSSKSLFNLLAEGMSLKISYTYNINSYTSDGTVWEIPSTGKVIYNITGVNDAPTASEISVTGKINDGETTAAINWKAAVADVDVEAVLKLITVNGVDVSNMAEGESKKIDINGGADGYMTITVTGGEQILTYTAVGSNITAVKGGVEQAFSQNVTYTVSDEHNAKADSNIKFDMTWVGKVEFAPNQESAEILYSDSRAADKEGDWINVGTLATSDKTPAASFALTDSTGKAQAVANADHTYTIYVKKAALKEALGTAESNTLTITFDYTNTGEVAETVDYKVNIKKKADLEYKPAETIGTMTEKETKTITYDVAVDWSDSDKVTSFEIITVGTPAAIASVSLSGVTGKTFDEAKIQALGTISGTTFTFTNDPSLFKQLGQGETLTLTYTYTLPNGYKTDGVTYAQALTGTVALTITGINDKPEGLQAYGFEYDLRNTETPNLYPESHNLLTGVTDPEGDPLTPSLAKPETYTGRIDYNTFVSYLSLANDGTLKIDETKKAEFYTEMAKAYIDLAEEVEEEFSINYQVSDGIDSATNTITFTVIGINDAPEAVTTTITDPVNLATDTGSKDVISNVASDPDKGDSATAALDNAYDTETVPTDVSSAFSFVNNTLKVDTDELRSLYPFLAEGESRTINVNYTVTDTLGATGTGVITLTVNGHYKAPSFSGTIASQTIKYQSDETTEDEITIKLTDNFSGAYTADSTTVTLYTDAEAKTALATLAYSTTETTISTDRFLGTYWMTGTGKDITIHLKSNAYSATINASDLYAEISVNDGHENTAKSNRFEIALPEEQKTTVEFFLFATNEEDDTDVTGAAKTTKAEGTTSFYKLDMTKYGDNLRAGSSGTYGEYGEWDIYDKDGEYIKTIEAYKYNLEIWVYDTSIALSALKTGCLSYALQLSSSEQVAYIEPYGMTGGDGFYSEDNVYSFLVSSGSKLSNMQTGYAYRLGKITVYVNQTEAGAMAGHNIGFTIEGDPSLGLAYTRSIPSGEKVIDANVAHSQIKCNQWTSPQKIVGLAGTEYLTDNGFYVRTVDTATEVREDGTIADLGNNVDFLNEWQTHYSEIWIKGSDLSTYLGAAAQLSYNSEYFTVTDVTFGDFFGNGDVTVDEKNGTISLAALAKDGSFSTDGLILLARVAYQSGEDQGVAWDDAFSPISLEWEITGADLFTSGSAVGVYIGTKQIVELWGNPYDVNDDGVVNNLDFNKFALNYGSNIKKDSTYNIIFDYNRDGVVNNLDFNKFALMYGLKKEEVVAGKKQVMFPETFTQRYVGSTLNADSQKQVGMVFDAANEAWAEALGLDETVSVTLVVSDLEGDTLARAQVTKTDANGAPTAGIIYLDSDAAGHYWYSQLSDPVDASRYDLYTVLTHELGHFYGYDFASEAYVAAQDTYDYLADDGHSSNTADVMYMGINLGERKELTENDIQAAETILGYIANGYTGSEVGNSSEIVGLGQMTDTAEMVLETSGVDISGGFVNPVALTQFSDTEADQVQILIDTQAQQTLEVLGLAVNDAETVDTAAPLLARDQILEENYLDEADDEEEDDFSFAEGENQQNLSETIESVWGDEWLF